MKILIAEDDALMLKALDFRLKKEGYEVILTRNGKEALENIEELQPDLIVTDIMMPFSSGLEIVSAVRAKYQTPIIVLSGMGQESVIMEAFKLGADDYVTKPFSLNELLLRVKRLVPQQKLV